MENRELKIAIIVGVIMITICIVVFIIKKADSSPSEINIHVYKVNEVEKKYKECSVNPDKLIEINSEFKRALKLGENDRVIGQNINGTYRIESGDKFIAFDGTEGKNFVFRGDTKLLYNFETTLYQTIVEACK